ncbi:MAG: hypothetical protein AB2541_07335 [Candidatus Thiodiazotropha sp.]
MKTPAITEAKLNPDTTSSIPVSEADSTEASTSTMQSPDYSQQTQQTQQSQSDHGTPHNIGDSTQGSQSINQPGFINPMLLGTPLNMSNMMALHGPPSAIPAMPAMPGLSEQDVIRIAAMMKQMLQQEITQLVDLKVNSATESLKSELKEVQDRCKKLEAEVKALQTRQDDTEQYSRRMCLRISGIRETENEDVQKLVLDFSNKVNANIDPSDIDRVHRVGRLVSDTSDRIGEPNHGIRTRRNREIIIKFTNSNARLRLLRGRAKLREDGVRDVFINEDLTPNRKMLAYECRKLKKLNNTKVKKTWVYAGYPYILDPSGNKLKITSLSDLDEYQVAGATSQSMHT